MAPSIVLFVAARKGNQQKQKSTPKACDPVVTLRLGRGGPNKRATLIKVWYYKIAINSYKFCIRIYLNIDSCKIKIVRIACWSFRWSQWFDHSNGSWWTRCAFDRTVRLDLRCKWFYCGFDCFQGPVVGNLDCFDQDCFQQNKPLIS